VAEERLAHPKSGRMVERLLGSRLLRRQPSGRLDFSSTGFRQFVRNAWAPIAAARPVTSTGGRTLPYAIILAIAGLLLFLSQEETATRLIGLMTTLMGGLEAIRKQLMGAGDAKGSGK
jgi:hypothetical protein